jgi:hypothetical protein
LEANGLHEYQLINIAQDEPTNQHFNVHPYLHKLIYKFLALKYYIQFYDFAIMLLITFNNASFLVLGVRIGST